MRKFFRNSNSKKKFAIFAGLRKIAKRSEFASLRFAEKIPGFAFASLRFLIRKKIRFRFAFAIDFWPKFTALHTGSSSSNSLVLNELIVFVLFIDLSKV